MVGWKRGGTHGGCFVDFLRHSQLRRGVKKIRLIWNSVLKSGSTALGIPHLRSPKLILNLNLPILKRVVKVQTMLFFPWMILKGNLVARRGRGRFGFWDRIQNFTIFLPSLYSEHTGTIQMLSCTPCAPFGAEPPIVECHQSVTRSSQAAAANSLYLELTCKYSKAF